MQGGKATYARWKGSSRKVERLHMQGQRGACARGEGMTCSLRATSSSKALVRGDRLAFLKPLEGLEFGPSSSALKS